MGISSNDVRTSADPQIITIAAGEASSNVFYMGGFASGLIIVPDDTEGYLQFWIFDGTTSYPLYDELNTPVVLDPGHPADKDKAMNLPAPCFGARWLHIKSFTSAAAATLLNQQATRTFKVMLKS